MTALLILAACVALLLVRSSPGRAVTPEEIAQARREALDRQEDYAAERRERFARYAEHWGQRAARRAVVPFRAEGGR